MGTGENQSYHYSANLPITQFYKIAVDNEAPFFNLYGGTQDNATQGGPSRTNNVHGIRNSDWFITGFGNGFDPVIDLTNPNIICSQWQFGGLVPYARRSGEHIDIKPQVDKKVLRSAAIFAFLTTRNSPLLVDLGRDSR
jgi:hypothetical protein